MPYLGMSDPAKRCNRSLSPNTLSTEPNSTYGTMKCTCEATVYPEKKGDQLVPRSHNPALNQNRSLHPASYETAAIKASQLTHGVGARS